MGFKGGGGGGGATGGQDLVNFTRSMVAADGEFTLTCDGMYVGSNYVTSLNLTLDTANAAGALGIDTGSWATSTLYHLWMCYGTSGTTLVASTSSTFAGVTKPSGYDTAGRCVGGVITDSSVATDFLPAIWHKDICFLNTSGPALFSGTATTSPTTVTMSSKFPATCELVGGISYNATSGVDLIISPVSGITSGPAFSQYSAGYSTTSYSLPYASNWYIYTESSSATAIVRWAWYMEKI